MSKAISLSLLLLAVFANPVAAACNLFMAEFPAVRECVSDQAMVITLQSTEIETLHKEIETLKLVQGFHDRDIKRLSDRVLELRGDIELLKLRMNKLAK